MSSSNSTTLHSYEERIQEYIQGTSQAVAGAAKDWIDTALSGLPAEARTIELGSAFGRDAAYIGSKGFEIECTDAVPGFVAVLSCHVLFDFSKDYGKAKRGKSLLFA